MSEESDSGLDEGDEEVEVDDVLSDEGVVVFGEGKFEEIKVGFKDDYRIEEVAEDLSIL